MWIKSLGKRKAWVNINHITHFEIKSSNDPVNRPYDVVAYLNAGHIGYDPRQHQVVEGQAPVTVKRGTYQECEQFIEEQISCCGRCRCCSYASLFIVRENVL